MSSVTIVSMEDVTSDTRRGGDIRTLLSPKSAGSTSGFMGVARLSPGETVSSHLHPYSEEFVFCASGSLTVYIDKERHQLGSGSAMLIKPDTPHRLANEGSDEVVAVYQLGPLAPRPELGHVDLEAGPGDAAGLTAADSGIGGPGSSVR